MSWQVNVQGIKNFDACCVSLVFDLIYIFFFKVLHLNVVGVISLIKPTYHTYGNGFIVYFSVIIKCLLCITADNYTYKYASMMCYAFVNLPRLVRKT